jgi:acetoin:2,6-dichlorophenolindophenol oxidoreductase subunit alpha
VATKEQAIGFYEMMYRIMYWEQHLLRMIDEGYVSGIPHLGRGQEAVPTGACAALRKDDYIMYAHRGVGYEIAKGLSLVKIYGDFLANTAGTCTGLGAGIVHIAWPELGIMGQSGTLGEGLPIAAGLAWAAQYAGTDQVCVAFFGDGTSNRGVFQESLNASSIWNLPVVWLCENNFYGVSGDIRELSATGNVVDRAPAYNMPGVRVDGMDPVAVYEVVDEAVKRARRGEGPTLIEAATYRYSGHYYGEPGLYRSQEEVDEWLKKDPIPTFAKRLVEEGIATEAELAAVRERVEQEVKEAANTAIAAPKPPDERMFEGVYAPDPMTAQAGERSV